METPHLEHPVLNCDWILIQLRFSVYVYIYIVAFCCGDPTLRTSQMLTCIIPTFDGIYFVATVDRSAGSLLYPKAPKQGFGCSQKSRSIYMHICIYIFLFLFLCIYQTKASTLAWKDRYRTGTWENLLRCVHMKFANIAKQRQPKHRELQVIWSKKETCAQSLWWDNVW